MFSCRAVLGSSFPDDVAQDLAVTLGRDRQPVLKIPGGQTAFAGVVAQLDIAVFQRLPVGRADDRQQHAGAGPVRQNIPVDVERDRMGRGRAPFQHVEPPRIVGEMHANMVGHEIENKPEIALLQCGAQPLEAGIAAKLGIDPGMIDDVIAMGAALARFHEGRCVEMRDPERPQVGDDGGRGVEIEIRRELHAVSRDRDGRRHQRRRRQNTAHGEIELLGLAAPDWRARRSRLDVWGDMIGKIGQQMQPLRRHLGASARSADRYRRQSLGQRRRPRAGERSLASVSREAPAPAPAVSSLPGHYACPNPAPRIERFFEPMDR